MALSLSVAVWQRGARAAFRRLGAAASACERRGPSPAPWEQSSQWGVGGSSCDHSPAPMIGLLPCGRWSGGTELLLIGQSSATSGGRVAGISQSQLLLSHKVLLFLLRSARFSFLRVSFCFLLSILTASPPVMSYLDVCNHDAVVGGLSVLLGRRLRPFVNVKFASFVCF